MRTAIIYESKYGATKKIASVLQEKLEADCYEINEEETLENYDVLIFGSCVYAGVLGRKMCDYLKKHIHLLQKKKLFLYYSGLMKEQDAIEKVFLENVGNDVLEKCQGYTCLGGVLDFNKMNFMEKTLIKVINKKVKLYSGNQKIINLIDDKAMDDFIEKIKK